MMIINQSSPSINKIFAFENTKRKTLELELQKLETSQNLNFTFCPEKLIQLRQNKGFKWLKRL
jgi:hypothetical protein